MPGWRNNFAHSLQWAIIPVFVKNSWTPYGVCVILIIERRSARGERKGEGRLMRCTACQREISEGSRFCKYCGVPVEQPPAPSRCPRCGSDVKAGAAFCRFCGASLQEAAAPEPPQQPEVPRQQQVPPRRSAEKPAKKKSNSKKIALIAAVLVAVVALLVVLLWQLFGMLRRFADGIPESSGTETVEQAREEAVPPAETADESREDTARAPAEQEPEQSVPVEEAPAAEPEREQLQTYMGTDIYYLSVKIGDMSKTSTTDCLTFSNGNVELSALPDTGEVYQIIVCGEDAYAIEGVFCGMELADAEKRLKENGYTPDGGDGSCLMYVKNDMSITLLATSNTVEAVGLTDMKVLASQLEKPSDGPDDYLLPDSDSRYLTDEDLARLTHEQLCFARNEIYARHGRIFVVPEVAAYFAGKNWYHGTIQPANFNTEVLNEYEKANIQTISAYEKAHFGGSFY